MSTLYKPFYDKNITPKNKKYSVYVMKVDSVSDVSDSDVKKPTLIHFGDRRYEHYFDKIGRWSNLNHNDKKRRKSYRARAEGIGDESYKDKDTANYWAYNMLW